MARGIELTSIPLTAVSGIPQTLSMGGQVASQGPLHYPALDVPVTVTVTFQGTGGVTPVAILAISTDGGFTFTQFLGTTFTGAVIFSTANSSYSWVVGFPITHLQISITGTAPNASSVNLCVQPQV